MRSGTYAIALNARDEAHLRLVSYRLSLAGVKHTKVFENDTPFEGQLMAIGVVPCDRRTVRKHLADLPLVK